MLRQDLISIMRNERRGLCADTARVLLRVLSWVYGTIVCFQRRLYTSGMIPRAGLGRPTLCVGNVTTGGAGKTPVVMRILRYLRATGHRPAVLMRGYMPGRASDGAPLPSDEAAEYRYHFSDVPLGIHHNRRTAAQKILAETPETDCFIMDDGFQHWPVKRDLDIVVIDATDPFGGSRLLPRGFLREPVSGIRRADAVVVTRADQAPSAVPDIRRKLLSLKPDLIFAEARHKPVGFFDLCACEELSADALAAQEAFLVSGIGNPSAFESSVQALGIKIIQHWRFPDHYAYTEEDMHNIRHTVRRHPRPLVITTMKDCGKWVPFLGTMPDDVRVLAVMINIEIFKGEHEILEKIDHLF
ncbi:MAG: tetraacyldisaccharide 4'-kinase [Candidatus Omnitrophota bacterium]